jgi:hypothetical protein
VSSPALRTVDQIDAGLAALTGLLALEGEFCALGDPQEGVIVLPARAAAIHRQPYRRGTDEREGRDEPSSPGLSACACGHPDCDRVTGGEFAPGHDGKRKSILWKQARAGEVALRELKVRGWDPPPEMR